MLRTRLVETSMVGLCLRPCRFLRRRLSTGRVCTCHPATAPRRRCGGPPGGRHRCPLAAPETGQVRAATTENDDGRPCRAETKIREAELRLPLDITPVSLQP